MNDTTGVIILILVLMFGYGVLWFITESNDQEAKIDAQVTGISSEIDASQDSLISVLVSMTTERDSLERVKLGDRIDTYFVKVERLKSTRDYLLLGVK